MPGDLYHPELRPYLDSLVPQRHPELAAMEAYAAEHGFPIIGPASGQFCYLMARALGARRVFELGSGYGYSTAWFCRAVKELGGGEVHHVVWDRKLSEMAQEHLGRMGFSDLVRFTVGEAVDALKKQQGEFDLIFNDIEKHDYPGALPVIYDKLRPGGLMIVDNALWSGRVFDPTDQSDATEGIRTLTQLVCRDPAWAASIVPIRDGLLVALKK